MIAAFLLPFPLRGYRAPYLWVYYRLLSSFGERMLFIASEDYTREPEYWRAQNRWETQAGNADRLHYRIPTREVMAAHEYGFLSEAVYETLLAESGGNPIAAFRRLVSERVPCLDAAFAEILSQPSAKWIEAILTWCNCPSLSAAAEEKGIPVAHLEVGPLRWPQYRPTAYFDFSGVNGNTEAGRRFLDSGFRPGAGVDTEALRRFFSREGAGKAAEAEFRLGVALQVEDDSNLLAFGHGFDNQSLLVYAHLHRAEGSVLVRGHPGSLFALKPDWYTVDDSADSVAFIRRCERILTINSSVGLEAMLMGKPVEVLGDCAHRFIAEAGDEPERLARLAFYLFAYLVPMQLIFDPGYLRFRLGRPMEFDIVTRHLDTYLDGDGGRHGLDKTLDASIRHALDFRAAPSSETTAGMARPSREPARVVDVIVPVYKGFEETRRCIESVLRADCATPFELVLIDDASPEPALAEYCAVLGDRPDTMVLVNTENLGFVATVNRGMSLHPDRDVVLLNSDTEVANDWLDRLRTCVYSAPDIATATPFSNYATICSYPVFCADNAMPPDLGLAELDGLFARLNAGAHVDIPTAVGFCTYIRRDCLDQVGLFDAERFGRGYGEENDFSRRAAKAGWRNVLCADTFVFHAGGVSFGSERATLAAAGAEALSRLHPEYDELVQSFVAEDPPAQFRRAVDIELARRRKRRKWGALWGWCARRR
jgi:GT2 family glycosyltransferase